MVCRLLIYHVKPMLICHLIATMRTSYNTGAAANLNTFGSGLMLRQDIRRIVHDGASSENICSLHLNQGLINTDHDIFLDRRRLQSTFVKADVLQNSHTLARLEGTFDMILAGSLFHLFD